MRKLLCKIGWHKFGDWKMSPFQVLSNDGVCSYIKTCKRCGHEKHGDW